MLLGFLVHSDPTRHDVSPEGHLEVPVLCRVFLQAQANALLKKIITGDDARVLQLRHPGANILIHVLLIVSSVHKDKVKGLVIVPLGRLHARHLDGSDDVPDGLDVPGELPE